MLTQNILKTELLDIFHWLHRHPELSYQETGTTAKLRETLQQVKIRILDLPLQTGLVAEIGTGDPLIALRADIDALPIEEQTSLPYRSEHPGKMHACGHDFHTTTMLGAALLLKAEEENLHGRVRMVFQPAEEAPGGALRVLETNALEGVQAIFGLHASPVFDVGTIGLREGAVTAAVDHFKLQFIGKGTHAAHPEGGIDPILMASNFVASVQSVVTRNLNPFAAGLVSVTHVEAGNTWNVIPETAFVEGTTRSLAVEDRETIQTRCVTLAEQIAKAYGGTLKADWRQGPPATKNDPTWTDFARKIAEKEGLHIVPAPQSLGGEDFAYYQEKIKGTFVIVGTGKGASIHNPKFQVNPQAILPTAKFFAQLAKEALLNV